jgi:beta-lactamase class C
LSHSTGYHFPGNSQIEQGLSRAKLLSTLQKQQPKCKPGKCYQYSNTTFSLVEEALNRKKLSLKAAIDNMRTVLNTQGIQILPITDNMEIAYPHSRKIKDGKEIITPLPFPPYYPKTIPASAGIFASIDGMIEVFKLSFGYRPDLISQKTLDIMYTPLQSSDDHVKWNFDWPVDQKMIESHYALGWRILRLKGQPKKDLIFHPGFINGINSFMGYIPAEEIGIIILANQRSGFPFKSGVRFWGEFLK